MTAPRSLHFDHMYASIEGQTELEWHQFWTTSLSVKGAFFREHRITFDPGIRYLHDHAEVGQRLSEHGFRLYYDPECLGHHDHAITEDDLFRNAEREAHSLVYWARKRPDRVGDLARFGYTPVKKTWERAVKYPLLAVVFNVVTVPLWRGLARIAWPVIPGVSRFLLSQCYAATKRRRLASLLAKAAAVLLLVLTVGCSGDSSSPAPPSAPPASYIEAIKGTDVTFEMIWVPDGNFWIGKTEVTWDEYLLYCDFEETGKVPPGVDAVTKPSKPLDDVAPFDRDWGKGRRPAVGMSWNGARTYCRWLSLNTSNTYRLPTEAEWALACGPLPDDLDDHAWHFENSGGMTQEVGKKKPNARGLHDMYGNLWEHVSDPWSGEELERACYRGGAWRSKPQELALEARLAFEEAWTMLDPNVPPGVWWVPDGDHLGLRVLRPGPKSR
ncbi:MAG: SUMF1/EgtB/PvdO family nonheme iron enzyme [Planctomycetes bacterium]|nr:SUMF1/EgtB/PvdO family nonheme iron enzyme [Planctomycetota bacterium]